MQNGKLMLSMNDAIALALENNLDIAISRYNLNIADTDVLRTKAGATLLGVNTGVVQRHSRRRGRRLRCGHDAPAAAPAEPRAALGGAGIRHVGHRQFHARPWIPVLSYDPIVTGTLQLDRNDQPSTSFFSGRFSNHCDRELDLPAGLHHRHT